MNAMYMDLPLQPRIQFEFFSANPDVPSSQKPMNVAEGVGGGVSDMSELI